MLGDVEAAERHAEHAVALAEALGEPAVLAETLADLALIQMLRRRSGYRATLDRALALERDSTSAAAADQAPLAFWWMTAGRTRSHSPGPATSTPPARPRGDPPPTRPSAATSRRSRSCSPG